jgi:hypothetical protein
MLGLDPLLYNQVAPILKYTIIVSFLTLSPFLVRGVTYRRERAALHAAAPATVGAAAGAAAGAPLPTQPPRRFAPYPFLTGVGVLTVLAYAGTTIGASVYERLNPPPVNLSHFTLPREAVIALLVWGVTCLVGIACALYVVVRSIWLRRWDWLLVIAGLLVVLLAVIESGNEVISWGDTFFSVLIFGPATAIIFGLFGPTDPTDWPR